jgi:hypothetical protein
MRFFLAGIMQGSRVEQGLHTQDYRQRLRGLIRECVPEADVYDPLTDHRKSAEQGANKGRDVFFHHNRMCREVDALIAFLPEASMGTAIEMWEAHQHGAAVFTISPLRHNWAVKFLSHALYDSVEQFEQALRSGQVAELLRAVRSGARPGTT